MERLWERSRKERKETNSKAEYRNQEGRHEKSGRREGGNQESESGNGHRKSHCEARPGREGKEEQRLSSQNPKLKRTKECRNSGGQKAERKRRQAVEFSAQKGLKRKQKTRVSRKEAAAEIEADGRRKEIADEIRRPRLKSRGPF